MLSSFSEDNNQPDSCYVQTAQLDGETNLKLRKALADTAEYFNSDERAARFEGVLSAEQPNEQFGRFVATLTATLPVRARRRRSGLDPFSAPRARSSSADELEEYNAGGGGQPKESNYPLGPEQTLLRGRWRFQCCGSEGG